VSAIRWAAEVPGEPAVADALAAAIAKQQARERVVARKRKQEAAEAARRQEEEALVSLAPCLSAAHRPKGFRFRREGRNSDLGLGTVQGRSGHGPFTITCQRAPEAAQSLFGPGQQITLRPLSDCRNLQAASVHGTHRVPPASWDMDWTCTRKCRYPVGGQGCAPKRLSCSD
jgi:hypothetical protein